ncbi:MAG TPA: hypothetical protein VK699_12245 [Terriglobales bacterium]|jgi:hypothetical protein|nr:hypothetical protein [Terriglobales bacterium]
MGRKFTAAEVATFRRDLLDSGLDWCQTAEVIRAFIINHGYGVSTETAMEAARRIDGAGCNLDFVHKELETLALVM